MRRRQFVLQTNVWWMYTLEIWCRIYIPEFEASLNYVILDKILMDNATKYMFSETNAQPYGKSEIVCLYH